MSESKKAFITGITGQDGSYLAELLLEKGYEVHGLVRRTSHQNLANVKQLIGKIKLHYGDLTDETSLALFIQAIQPDEVYNLGSQSVPRESWRYPVMTGDVTALGVTRLLETLHQHAPKAKFYQASTSELFGDVSEELVTEDSPMLANNPYAVAKLYGHLMARTYREGYGMFACSGILFNHESPRRSPDFVTRKVTLGVASIKLGLTGEQLPTNEDGEPILNADGKLALGDLDTQRDWGFSGDYVRAMWQMLQHEQPDDYVIAMGELHSMRDLCKIAFERFGLDWEQFVYSDPRFIRPTEISPIRGDASKAKQVLGWEPTVSFEQLIQMMVDADLERLGGSNQQNVSS